MATKKIYDLLVKTGSYESSGETKGRYQNIGVVLEKDDGGRFILMDRAFNPAGVPHDVSKGNTIMVSMFEPKQDEGHDKPPREEPRRQSPYAPDGGKQGPAAQSADDFSDDIPF